jgi:pyrimidine deaminase RibD-like protein
MLSPQQDLAFMEKAFELSTHCKPEDDHRKHPFVGACIVRPNGDEISRAFRGQNTPGNHAEQEALHGIADDVLRDAIVYTTLEPCTVRAKEASCCSRLIRAEVSEVVIGMLDPNRDIRGRGWWELEQKGIVVRNFASPVVQKVRWLNRDFIDYQLGVGLLITAVQADGCPVITVTSDHRAGKAVIEVPQGRLIITGSYRVKPTRGDRIRMIVHRGNRYFPQMAVNFDHDRDKALWQAPSAWVRNAGGKLVDNELIIARVSDDLDIAFQHYNTVHADLLKQNPKDHQWLGVIMDPEPPGFERLASLGVRVP